ncbi:sterile alpha motif domain-containing protein 9-like isoform X2 [Bombina bombina]|nr:sterile alpha motif domain-containing protein 9-like isoform X2 [Bombina bombina]XP_053563611.1 sterile alpha motif domain-containing protein 9-like isoform X2 [Bombina bombina]
MDYSTIPVDEWQESHVSNWLSSIKLKKKYIDKLFNEEVTGIVLIELSETFFRETVCMKEGQISLLIKKRNELLKERSSHIAITVDTLDNSNPTVEEHNVLLNKLKPIKAQEGSPNSQKNGTEQPNNSSNLANTGKNTEHLLDSRLEPILQSHFRPFDNDDIEFKYVRNQILPSEIGVTDLVTPCHEYILFAMEATLGKKKLQSKFAYEVFRFAAACMNVRTNGTIHFGVMGKTEDKNLLPGQIVGIPVSDKSWYSDALDFIKECFSPTEYAALCCIRPPKFIAVVQEDSEAQLFAVEVDIESLSSSVAGKLFQVCLPIFNETSKTVCYEEKTIYRRIGTQSVAEEKSDYSTLKQKLQTDDTKRKQADSESIEIPEALDHKVSVLFANGSHCIDNSQWYVLVINKCGNNHLKHLNFLMQLNILCVFDFDADSDSSGLCAKYKQHHATNMYSLISHFSESVNSKQKAVDLGLFKQTSWIFCNGWNNNLEDDEPCDEYTWFTTKRKSFKNAVSFIYREIIKMGRFTVLFLLLSPVEKPMVDAFHTFYQDMKSVEYITFIAEHEENYRKWVGLVEESCSSDEIEQRSIVGTQLSIIDATVQKMLPTTDYLKSIPNSKNRVYILTLPEAERMYSLNILCINECNHIKLHHMTKQELKEIESIFYRGGKISWKHLWLSDQKQYGEIIERDACIEVERILHSKLHRESVLVARIKIVHKPGSGGSTVARQILWKYKDHLRCAVVDSSCPVTTVYEHALMFRDYDQKDINGKPVLLLIEDSDEEYVTELMQCLTNAMSCKKMFRPCFIILTCRRSNDPQKLCAASPNNTVAITHTLSDKERKLFEEKSKEFSVRFPSERFMIFDLMRQGFPTQNIHDFVSHAIQFIDSSSSIAKLIRYTSLLNHYVPNSYIPISHCEAFMGFGIYIQASLEEPAHFELKNYLTDQSLDIFVVITDNEMWITGICISHSLIADQILNLQSNDYPHSQIALDLIKENNLFQHRFGKEAFLKLVKKLFLQRHKKSKGDSRDTLFSPLIEHVWKEEKLHMKAVELLKCAYESFDKDPFFAQHIARLYGEFEMFDEAIAWAETAALHFPHDSFILDTLGQMHKKKFNATVDAQRNNFSTEDAVKLIETGLKSMECFRVAQKAARLETGTMNTSGFLGEIDVGCHLIERLSKLKVFYKNSELLPYLLTDHYPTGVKKPWIHLHDQLKALYENIYNAMEWVSDDAGYFENDSNKEHICMREQYGSRKWLLRKTEKFATFFSLQTSSQWDNLTSSWQNKINQVVRRMNIYRIGGGSTTAILSILTDSNDGTSIMKLEEIIDLYPRNVLEGEIEDVDLINFLMTHIALGCAFPDSSKLMALKKLRKLSKKLIKPKTAYTPGAYLLLVMLFWPDESVDQEPDPNKDIILTTALQAAKRLYEKRIKNVQEKKKRTNVHFLLGQGDLLQKFVHKSNIEKVIQGPLNERNLKQYNEEMYKANSENKMLKKVSGWTENGKMYITGHCKEKIIEILPTNSSLLPRGNHTVSFYLGFAFKGIIAYNIQVK